MKAVIVPQIGEYTINDLEYARDDFWRIYLGFKENPENKFAIYDMDLNPLQVLRESGGLLGLKHQNIISLNAVYQKQKGSRRIFLITEFCSNGKLFDYLKNTTRTPELVLRYTKEIFSGFRYLYENNIIHQDIRPDNLLIDSNGTLKIAEIGFSKMIDDGDYCDRDRAYRINKSYVSFEILSGYPYTSKSDVYSVAVVLFELAYGHHPMFPTRVPKSTSDLHRTLKLPIE